MNIISLENSNKPLEISATFKELKNIKPHNYWERQKINEKIKKELSQEIKNEFKKIFYDSGIITELKQSNTEK